MSFGGCRSEGVHRRLPALLVTIALAALVAFGTLASDAVIRQAAAQTTSADAPTVRSAPVARGQAPQVNEIPATDLVAAAHRSASDTADPAPARPGEVASLAVTLRNLGVETWPAAGPGVVRLSYHLYDASGALVAWDGL